MFTTFIEPYVFKEKIKLKDILIAFITLFGVVLIIPKFELGNNVTQGFIWGVVSGFTFAILSILNRKYIIRYLSTNSTWIYFYCCFTLAVY